MHFSPITCRCFGYKQVVSGVTGRLSPAGLMGLGARRARAPPCSCPVHSSLHLTRVIFGADCPLAPGVLASFSCCYPSAFSSRPREGKHGQSAARKPCGGCGQVPPPAASSPGSPSCSPGHCEPCSLGPAPCCSPRAILPPCSSALAWFWGHPTALSPTRWALRWAMQGASAPFANPKPWGLPWQGWCARWIARCQKPPESVHCAGPAAVACSGARGRGQGALREAPERAKCLKPTLAPARAAQLSGGSSRGRSSQIHGTPAPLPAGARTGVQTPTAAPEAAHAPRARPFLAFSCPSFCTKTLDEGTFSVR